MVMSALVAATAIATMSACSADDDQPTDSAAVGARGAAQTPPPMRTVGDQRAGKVADDAPVRLRGRAVSKIDDDEYRFTDRTGVIRLDVGDRPAGGPLPLDRQITVDGTYDRGDGEVDVTAWHD